MLTPKATIRIADMVFYGCIELKVKRHIDEMSATATVALPRTAMYDSKVNNTISVANTVKPGDPVAITAGYEEDAQHRIFTGYVRNVIPDQRVTIEMEDAMMLLRKKEVILSEKELKKTLGREPRLADMLREIIRQSEMAIAVSESTADMAVGEFRFKGSAVAAMSKLKEQFSLALFINEENQIYAGEESTDIIPAAKRREAEIKLIYGQNIITNNVEYKSAADDPLHVTVRAVLKTGAEDIVKTAGDKTGRKVELVRYNVTDGATAQKIADMYHAQNSYDGFRGSLTLFGIPKATVGGTAVYRNDNYEHEDGNYLIKGVTTSLSTGGLRQEVILGHKIK